ncbi:hypothetical protein EDC96DRAFT_452773 [Choanephora cucurbitarum]|nr:hypothetical protein EDC96DRAFT_452773 [Choanephora cucurbitarum]
MLADPGPLLHEPNPQASIDKDEDNPHLQSSRTQLSTSNPNDTKTPIPNKRAALYKFSRKTVENNRSKVGSMVLEFDALAHKSEDNSPDDSDAWLLLDNKTLSRQYLKYNTANRGVVVARPSVSSVFPSASVSSNELLPSIKEPSQSNPSADKLALETTSREDELKRRDHSSPFYFVERLRSRNVTIDALTKHLISLQIVLSSGTVSWINEFLSRRHGGLIAMENLLEKLVNKKSR